MKNRSTNEKTVSELARHHGLLYWLYVALVLAGPAMLIVYPVAGIYILGFASGVLMYKAALALIYYGIERRNNDTE